MWLIIASIVFSAFLGWCFYDPNGMDYRAREAAEARGLRERRRDRERKERRRAAAESAGWNARTARPAMAH